MQQSQGQSGHLCWTLTFRGTFRLRSSKEGGHASEGHKASWRQMTLGTEALQERNYTCYLNAEVACTEAGKESTLQACSRCSGRLPTYLGPGQLDLLMQPLSQEIQRKDRVRCCALAS